MTTNTITILECGHSPNAVDEVGNAVCVIHNASQGGDKVSASDINLSSRMAKCGSCDRTRPSDTSLAFFEYLGEYSQFARNGCKNCGNFITDHAEVNPYNGKTGFKYGVCDFSPKGDLGYDRYYCGCRGWD